MAECCVHPGVEAVRRCTVCGKEFCSTCFLDAEDQVCRYCRNRNASSTGTTIIPSAGTPRASQQTQNSQTAMISLILSIIGFCCCPILYIISLILSIMAKKELKEHPGMTGEGMATAAFWISIIGLILTVIAVIIIVICVVLGVAAES
ncbi:MAG TPA: DUF4190 domain-containing protein [Bacillota bacterium]|nr:DUF4190 domain-containing protein [Bacillota bacterium]